jgi:quercetin dioxygenase-like cupin family protein
MITMMKLVKGKPTKLADLVAYQKDAIVSSEIIKKKTGTVTLFAFDQGQGLSEHTVSFDALVSCLDGEAKVIIAGKPQRIKSGDSVIMPAHKPHALNAVKRFKMLLVLIK